MTDNQNVNAVNETVENFKEVATAENCWKNEALPWYSIIRKHPVKSQKFYV